VPYLSYILTALGAYLLGSIPTGYLAAKAKGIDIRTVGSGNIGATNAMRVLGKPIGITVLLLDALKGFVACYFGVLIHVGFTPICPLVHSNAEIANFYNESPALIERFAIVAGICAVLGHNYTCWLKFKGGKGIATSAGVYLALAPGAIGITILVFVLAVVITRYVSVGSIAAGLTLPIAVWFTHESTLLRVVTIAIGALAIYKHKGNIQRLAAGTENRLGGKPKETTQ
jgi:glycerol-3-phosphate acyltransferase PlsY